MSTTENSHQVTIRDLHCAIDGQPIIQGLDLAIERGSIQCLLGPSGCGKTTVLRSIAGFNQPTSGQIRLRDRTVAGDGQNQPPEHRGVGLVQQDFALFPHLSVRRNVEFGIQELDSAERQQRVDHWLAVVGLGNRAERMPDELSGGEQQRVALARALAPEPDLLLLDEPFSSLDASLRESLAHQLRELLKSQGVTTLLVTHDQSEAFAMADRIAVMRSGRIEQDADPHTLYHQPGNRFVAGFVGKGRWVPGTVNAAGRLQTLFGTLDCPAAQGQEEGSALELLLRPDDVVTSQSGISAEVVDRRFQGAEILYVLNVEGQEVLALFPSHADHAVGSTVTVGLDAEHRIAFPPEEH